MTDMCHRPVLYRTILYSNLSRVQDEVLLEFHVDDTADDREDTLVEMAFHVPPGNTHWGADAQQADGEDQAAAVPAAKVRGWLAGWWGLAGPNIVS